MSKGKRLKENNKENKTKKSIIFFLQIILIIIMIYSGLQIYKWYKDNKRNSEILNSISKLAILDNNEYKIDFAKLKEINSDTVAYLKVNGTDIEYPVVKSINNDYYLTHSFDKSYNGAGWVFADYTNKFDGTDRNIIVYGHNRKDGSMFGTLKNILNKDWHNDSSNKYLSFDTENNNFTYEVFSVYRVEKEDYYLKTNFSDNEFEEYIRRVKTRSIKDFKTEVTVDDQILTLSTCADNNKYRVVLHAKKL